MPFPCRCPSRSQSPRTRPDSRSGSEITDWWYELTVSSKEYGALTRRVERDDQSDQEFRFQAAATLTLNVPGFDEHELRESLNWVVYGVDENGNTLSTINRGPHKGDGNKSPLKFGPFQPGRCRLELFYGSGHSSISLVREEVTLASGENVLTRNIPRLYALKVKCPNADDAPRLKLKRDGHTRYARSGDNSIQDNTVEFPYLIAGDYVLETRQGRMKVTVPAAGTVEFAPPPFDCIVMSSIKEGGIVEGLGLRNGDRLIAIDGDEIGMGEIGQAKIMVSLSKTSTTWKVLRNGVETEVIFDGTELMEALKNKRKNGEDLDFDPGYRDD